MATPAARAQGYGGGNAGNIYTYQVPIRIPIPFPVIAQEIKRESQDTKRKSPRVVRRKTPKKALATTTYRASPAVSKQVQTRLIAFVAKSNSPETVAQLKRDLQTDLIGAWAKQMAADGLKRGDVADAMTANWVQSWQVANNVMETKRAQVQGARRQLASILTSNAGFAKLSNAQRQEMAEGFIYSQALQSAAYLDAVRRGDKTLQKQISDGTHVGFKKSMGLDLRTVKLSNTGFAIKS